VPGISVEGGTAGVAVMAILMDLGQLAEHRFLARRLPAGSVGRNRRQHTVIRTLDVPQGRLEEDLAAGRTPWLAQSAAV
jgi:hypothetical protein